MAPVPDDNQDNQDDNQPIDIDSEELELPSHIIPAEFDSSNDEGEFDSEAEDPAQNGYMLLPQDPEDEEVGIEDTLHPHQLLQPVEQTGETLPPEPMTEVRGTGIDLTEAVAQGNVHPAFAASFPDNKVPVHLQVPNLPKVRNEDVFWNQSPPASERLQMDSVQQSKVKLAMAGFQLPATNIPNWAHSIPEDQWKQHLIGRFTSLAPVNPIQLPSCGNEKNAKNSAPQNDQASVKHNQHE